MQPQQSQTYGIKIAQPGYNVLTAKDYELIFNSSWPALSVAYDQDLSLTTDNTGTITTTIPHNLGFYPLVMGWQFTDSTKTVSAGRFFPNVDNNNFYLSFSGLFSGSLVANTTYYVNIKAYNLDISQPQIYTYLQSPAVNTPYDSTYGIKVVKKNLSIQSTDLRSFILHSRAASPQVLAVVTEKTTYNATTGIGNNNGTLTYTNPAGYVPWVFAYAQVIISSLSPNPMYQWAFPTSQAYPRVFFGTQTTVPLNLSATTPLVGSLVVLRDPLFVSNTVNVTY